VPRQLIRQRPARPTAPQAARAERRTTGQTQSYLGFRLASEYPEPGSAVPVPAPSASSWPSEVRYFSSYEHMRNDGEDDDYIGQVYVPHRPWKTDIRCFRHRLRRINLVGYRGSRYERMLAKFLLSKAQALVEFSVSLAPVRSLKGDEITRELTSWRCRRRTRVICT
jgi:hypothetical protein